MKELLDDFEEEFDALGYVGLHTFSWALRVQGRDLSESQIQELARAGYDEFVSRHDLQLAWIPASGDSSSAIAADPGTPLAFDLPPEHARQSQLLALAPCPIMGC